MTYAKINAAQILQFGSDDDSVAFAAIGTELPTDLSALPVAWLEVGWIHEEGMKFTPSDSVEKRKGHQGHRVYRTTMTDSSTDFAFQALQSNLQTLALQWQIKESKEAGGVFTHRLSNVREITATAICIDVYANDHHYRYVCPRFEIGERSEVTLSATVDTVYAIKGTFTEDIILITDDPAYKPAA